jgi:hypothetical protein
MVSNTTDKNSRGSASQFFVAGELCRRGYVAVVTMGNTPNTDILVSNSAGTNFVHVQVKTFIPGRKTVSVGKKAEKFYGERFVWILAGIPLADSDEHFEYFIIPSKEVSKNVSESHQIWLSTPGKNGEPHNDNDVRTIHLPPGSCMNGWEITRYKNDWSLIDRLLGN